MKLGHSTTQKAISKGPYKLEFDSRREAFDIALAMGPTFSAFRLGFGSLFKKEGAVVAFCFVEEADMRSVVANLKPDYEQVHEFVASLGATAIAETAPVVLPLPVIEAA